MLCELRHKKTAVLGFGLEGKTVIKYLSRHGIKPVLFDQSNKSKFSPSDIKYISSHCSGYFFGKGAFNKLEGFDIAFKSPGIPPRSLNIFPKKLCVTSQTAEFLKLFADRTIGVTGTKGKGTTCSLIYNMLKADGRSVYLTGNIGEVQAFDFMDRLKKDDLVVFELSSFQLREAADSPHVAVVLMTTSEHLNWHPNLRDYWHSKTNITGHQKSGDYAISNFDYAGSRYIGKQGRAKKLFISRYKSYKNGCFAINNEIVKIDGNKLTKIIETSEISLKGEHNWENVCAATEAALLLGCKLSSVRKTLKNFHGLPHRLEYSGTKNGIKFFNDSFSTIPETTVAAIRSFLEPVVLILGGAGKKSDFAQMAENLARSANLRAAVVMGKEKKRILFALSKAGVAKNIIYPATGGFKQTFNKAVSLAKKGDVVLLSPACVSFDMFKNYKQRGDIFKSLVKKFHG